MAKKSTSVVSYDGGKFKLEVTYSFSDSAITWQAKINVTDKFKSKHTFKLKWVGADGKWKEAEKESQNGDYSFKQRTLAKQTLRVKVQVGSKSSSELQISNSAKAAAPTSIVVTKVNDARYTIVVKGKGYVTHPTQKLVLERAEGTTIGSWSQLIERTINATGSYEETFTDNTTSPGERYKYRVKAVNSVSGDSKYITSDYNYATPDNTVSDVSSSRSGSTNTIAWTYNSITDIDRGIVQGFIILRQKDGGAWVEIGRVEASTDQTHYSYEDNEANSDGVYKYAVQIYGKGGTSYDKTTDDTTLSTVPARPISVSAALNSADNVVINIENSSPSATNVHIERQIDGGAWIEIAEEDYPLPQYIDIGPAAADSLIYRVRNSNAAGYSEYTVSNTVNTKAPPNPPELKIPRDGAKISIEDGTVQLAWQHKPTDGSSQEAAQVRYKINDGAWHTYTKTTEATHSLDISTLSPLDVVTWQARTKGAHADYSDWSDLWSFTIYSKPELHFTSPDNGDSITELPLRLEWIYTDQSGTLSSLLIDIIDDSEVVATYVANGSELTITQFMFETEKVYGIRARALSTSGLSATETISISMQYEPVAIEGGLLPTVEFDGETGYTYITIMRDLTPDDETGIIPEPIDIAAAYLYRVHDRERELVEADINESDQIIDLYAPINVDYDYELMMRLSDGRISIVTVTCNNESMFWFVYYADGKIAKAKWNPNLSVGLKRPEKVAVRYSGRKYPVSYDTAAREETASFQTVLISRDDLVAFKEMMRLGGRGIWKSGDGDVFYADFEFDYAINREQKAKVWSCTLDVTRIERDI